MTSPRFRSTAAFAQRSGREVVHVDWATFVVFVVDGRQWAVPVECAERVVRSMPQDGAAPAMITHAGRQIPVFELQHAVQTLVPPDLQVVPAPTGTVTTGASNDGRWLILALPDGWVACLVQAVREVVTIDATTVRAVPLDDPRQTPQGGVRGAFTRREQEVLVLDVGRVVRAAHVAMPQSDV